MINEEYQHIFKHVSIFFGLVFINLKSLFIKKNIHTLSENNMMIQPKPKKVSVALVLWMFWKTLVIVSTNPDDVNFSPSRLLICDVAIITDVADVNPTVTGIDMKSISTPRKKK